MSKMTKEEQEKYGKDWYELTHKNWRAWGSWFSWGSPVGLGHSTGIGIAVSDPDARPGSPDGDRQR